MLLTREADYAVLCVLEMARHGQTSARAVAVRQGVSPAFLANIVHSLAKAGIAVTRRGAGGGISLARPPEELSVLEVVEAIQGHIAVNACVACPRQCPRADGCDLYPLFRRAQECLRDLLSVSFADVLEGNFPAGIPLLRPVESPGPEAGPVLPAASSAPPRAHTGGVG